MPRRRLNWTYDDENQQFTTPSGRTISLHEIAGLLHDHTECRFDFTGPWAGWRMRGAALIPPGGTPKGTRITATNGAAFARWIASANATEADSAPSMRSADHPALWPVCTSIH